ncbi:lipopolysaccharide ABC transporter permease [Porphyromonas crevioricanis]|uniref:Lipopolysaccharide ABC transporter permease n=2 Tax=Porphyromonas crevioricanis TaxID=393921 RepID=A0A2X4PZ55_9PORP|nr:membrane protein, putative [Porphyromonas crevioricanis JCM 13913]SJZ94226.1 lipopolysaccharide export system permease protein [Porphyromonas crevioricanis]SQH73609.1 lipopolysaccharide ABC transporter permease [Porphyromonas crevioricanis]
MYSQMARKVRLFTTIDRYILRQFLGTYFFSILLILSVAVVFDINEKISDFLKPEVPLRAIIFDYYLNFIPYYANLFSPLFTFISVIFFTTKLAENSEIIAMLAGGISFKRLMRPYMFSAAVIAILTFLLNSFLIPPANKTRIDFQNQYIKNRKMTYDENIQMEVQKDVFVYFGSYNEEINTGYQFSMEKFDGNRLVSRLTAVRTEYADSGHWMVHNYVINNYKDMKQEVITGRTIDTLLHIQPSDFLVSLEDMETMTTPQLSKYISRQQERGVGNAKLYAIELHKRYAAIMTAFLLTVIGLSLSARKLKGGLGFNIAIGLGLSFGYILFTTATSTFAVSGSMSPWMAAWLPNFVYLFIAAYIYTRAPR